MSIPLPPLPLFDGDNNLDIKDFNTRRITRAELRARDQEIVRCVLQAAAELCDSEAAKWKSPKYNYATAAALHCGTGIRALEFTHHE